MLILKLANLDSKRDTVSLICVICATLEGVRANPPLSKNLDVILVFKGVEKDVTEDNLLDIRVSEDSQTLGLMRTELTWIQCAVRAVLVAALTRH